MIKNSRIAREFHDICLVDIECTKSLMELQRINMLHNSNTDSYRYGVRYSFEHEEGKLQYRLIGTSEWRDATWSRWEWHKYDYRIKPDLEVVEVQLDAYLQNGRVVWATEEVGRGILLAGGEKILKFVTKNKRRTVLIER